MKTMNAQSNTEDNYRYGSVLEAAQVLAKIFHDWDLGTILQEEFASEFSDNATQALIDGECARMAVETILEEYPECLTGKIE